MQASLDCANAGFKVYLVEKQPSIGGNMARLDKTFPTNDCAMCMISPKLVEVGRHLNIEILSYSDLKNVEGQAGIDAANGRIGVSENQVTGEAMVFSGGDAVSGPDSIIGAISQGRKAAGAMDAYLGGDGNIDEVLATPEDEIFLPPFLLEVKSRNEMDILKPWARLNGFDQVEKGFSNQGIADEAARCLNCDARKFEVVLNMEYCKECGYCAEVCDVGTFGPADVFNTKGYRPAEVKSSDWCVGCFKCYFSCPDFAIDVAEITA